MAPLLKILLLPVAALYGVVVGIRNWLYNTKILKSTEIHLPSIVVGNLNAGGTGKTPHVEYLILLLKKDFKVCTLSRGYKRKSKGFLLAKQGSTSAEIGDEPLQYFHKFGSQVYVTVGEDRVAAAAQIIKRIPDAEVLLLDDAYQHRAFKPGMSILLTDYGYLYTKDYLLPTGRLRERRSGARRADIIIVSKTPSILTPIEKRQIISQINPLAFQKVFFTYIKYGEFLPTWKSNGQVAIGKDFYFDRRYAILLVCGIANPQPLYSYLKENVKTVDLMKFPDHHNYDVEDLEKIKKAYDNIINANKIILTTEKDWMRLQKPSLAQLVHELKIFYIPIEVAFHEKDGEHFNKQILEYVNSYHTKMI